jgi:peptidoglycan/xylan/chitin deacetylase (PgdA/CDA1 family)
MSLRARLVNLMRSFCYGSGLLGLLHRWRNKNTLTVFMFHRVLPKDSQAYAQADREFTFSTEGFERTLRFIRKHYSVVDVEQVRACAAGKAGLPPRAGLITFDDGWRDTLEHALPLLNKHQLPAVMFVVTDLLDSTENRWWQDALVEVMADDTRTAALSEQLGVEAGAERLPWRLATALAALPPEQRRESLARFVDLDLPQAQMVRVTDLMQLEGAALVIGAHGHSHTPLTQSAQPEQELSLSYARNQAVGGSAVMAFPHGSCNPSLVEMAHAQGFELVFTSQSALNSSQSLPSGLARLHIPENQWTCEGGQIAPARLATYVFFRPLLT